MSDTDLKTTPKPSVLLVDDDDRFRSRLARAFEERGYEAQQADSYDAALEIGAKESTEFAVVDLRMPGKSGLEVVRELHLIDSATKIVVLTGYGSIATAVAATKRGASQYLTKPVDIDELERALLSDEEPEVEIPEQFQSLDRHEREYIEFVLAECEGNISQAARRLGLHRQSLQRKLRKYTPN